MKPSRPALPIRPAHPFSRNGIRRIHSLVWAVVMLVGYAQLGNLLVAVGQDTTPGSLDALNPMAANSGATVWATAVQPDGKTILAGQFSTVLGVARTNIARLNADGTLDATFNPNANNRVYSVAVQGDGKILLVGLFTALQPNGSVGATPRNRIARLNADGTLDTVFNPNANSDIYSMAVQGDGKILLGGEFTTLQPNGAVSATVRNYVARVNADGTLDTTFNPNANSGVRSVALQFNGSILLGGVFTALQPNGAASATARNRIARLNADGTLDTVFNPNVNGVVATVTVQADGKILLGGEFTSLQPNGSATPTTRFRVARLNADGTLDTVFNPNSNSHVYSIAVQADGKVLLGGFFSALQPNGAAAATTRNRIARLAADGTLEVGFDPNASSHVYSIAVQADGKVQLGGLFATLQPNGAATATTRAGFARLNNDMATQSVTIPSASHVLWTRGGAAPEVSQVTVELSINGGLTWTPLGNATRVSTTANWQLTGLSLPGSGQIRVRGRTTGGYNNGSAGLVQAVASFNLVDLAVEQPAGTSLADGTGSVAFGTVTLGGSPVVRTVTIRNTGGGSLTGLAVTKDGAHAGDFTVGALGSTTVAPGATTTFTVSFAPGAAGARTAALHIASNVTGTKNPFDLNLTGSGLAVPDIAVEQPAGTSLADGTGSVALGSVALGNSGMATTVTIRNTGTAPLTGLVITKDGAHAGDFGVGGLGSTTVAPGGTTTFNVSFAPGAVGARTAAIHIASNVTGTKNPFDLNLTGTGLGLPDIAVEQPAGTSLGDGTGSVSFGTVTLGSSALVKTVTLRNTGTASLILGTITKDGAHAADYTVGALGTTTLAPGGTTTFTVSFSPGAAGARSAAIHIANNLFGAKNPFDLTLTGTGLLDTSPGSVDGLNALVAGGVVYTMAVQPDGKMLLGGSFTSVLGVARNKIARLNADGTLDTTFNPNANSEVQSVAVQADGKILLGGHFTTLQPNGAASATTRNFIARLNADGTLDTTFNPNANGVVYSVALQADGKILIGGAFLGLQPNGATATTRNHIARLNADGSLDTGFNPNANNVVSSIVVQADGKILLGGYFTTLQPTGAATATTRNRIARLNANGTLDTTFDPNANNPVSSVAVQADGKILLGGYFTTLQPTGAATATTRNSVARLNADGTLDTAFNPNANASVFSMAVQADGKILLGGYFTTLQPDGAASYTTRNRIARLNADGSLDTTFDPNANSTVYSVAVQADGKILLGGYFSALQPNGAVTPTPRNGFARLNNDAATQSLTIPTAAQVLWTRGGSAPEVSQVTFELSVNSGTTWTPLGNGTRVGTTANWQLIGLSLPNGGQIRARGRTTGGYFNGSVGLVEFVASFSLSPGIAVEQPAGTSLTDGTGSVAFGTVTVNFPATTRTFTIRNTGVGSLSLGAITKDGAHATDFTVGAPGSTTVAPGGATTLTMSFAPGAAGARTAAIHIASNVTGALNPFDLNLTGTGVLDSSPGSVDGLDVWVERSSWGSVSATAVQPDRKIILGGSFTSVNVTRNNIARLNADGTLDTVFNPNANDWVYSVAVQTDGKILLGGAFNTLQPNGAATAMTRNSIARLNPDGTVDTAFNPNANRPLECMVVQADGKILLGGWFTTLQPNGAATTTTRNHIARLNPDGTLDTVFDPNANGIVHSVAVQTDGKILLGGEFTTLRPNGAATATARNRVARLNADGSLDTTFNPNANSSVESIAVQADGKILLGGWFTTLQPNGAVGATTRNRIARLNANGTLDTAFDPNADFYVHSVAVQTDGKILFGGEFTTLRPNGAATATTRSSIARLNPDGTLDAAFDPNADWSVRSVTVHTDGKILIGGEFFKLQPNGAVTPTSRTGFARLNNDVATQSLTIPSAAQVVWNRGGSAPEVSQVTFELSVNGGTTWTLLGNGTRVGTTANWQLTGLSLSNGGQVRARGRTSSGFQNGSAGLVEFVANISLPPGIAVEQPAGTSLTDGTGSVTFGTATVGFPAATRTFTIRNTGTGSLSLGTITKDGAHAADFTVGAPGSTTVAPGGTTTFTVNFAPGAAGARTAAIHIASNVTGTLNPFDLNLNGTGLADTSPGSVDGLNALVGGGTVVHATAVQPDGKTVIAGTFTSVLGVARNNMARLNVDGTLDAVFNPNANGQVSSVAVQGDGKILIGGAFTTLQPNGAATATARNRIARLNADGSIDTAFNPNANSTIDEVLVQADGKILIAGNFATLQPNGAATATARNYLARLNADGTLDTAFNPSPNLYAWALALQADGKILLGGAFTTLQPNGAATATMRNRIARLNTDGSLDTGFNPNANSSVEGISLQSDGKILLLGQFTTLQPNGAASATPRNRIARLNTDGSLDTVFNPNANNRVFSLAVQADGKLLVGGAFTTLQPNGAATATARNRVARLNTDGTLDTAFNPNVNSTVYGVAVQADGKVLLGGNFTTLQPNGAATPTTRNGFARLNNYAATQSLTIPSAAQVVWTPGGSAPEVSQVTFELSVNGGSTWTLLGNGSRVAATASWQLTGLSLPTSGQIRARGRTSGGYGNGSEGVVQTVAVLVPPDIAVEQPAGTFLADGTGSVAFGTVTVGSSGLVKTLTIRNTGTGSLILGAITKDGANATEFTVGAPLSTTVAPGGTTTFTVSFAPGAAGARTAAIHIASNVPGAKNPFDLALTGTGVLDTTPGSVDALNASIAGLGATLWAHAVQPDGKTLLAGEFSSVLGVARRQIARLNSDGTLDTVFNPNANSRVLCVGVQPDGKILLGGVFTTLQPNGAATTTARNFIARHNADGSLDTGFNPNANNQVYSLAVQADGKILLGGAFTALQPNGAATATSRNRIARLNADGTLDTTFNPNANDSVQGLAVQADGKILVGGNFTTLQPNGAASATLRNRIARLNADGTLDTVFNPNANNPVHSVALQADGRILLGGAFTTLQPNGAATATARNYVARLNADGTMDTAFNPTANSFVFSVASQADGKILLGGAFTTLQPNGAASATARNYTARLNADGTLDTAFNPNPNNLVFSVAVQADGKVLLGGQFSALQPNGAATATMRNVFARLNNTAATQTLSAPTTAQVVWNRGGTAPELSQVTFELSVNGGATWTPLGAGSRVGTTANWQRTGLTLPTSGQLRARGRTAGGFGDGSAGLVETVVSFSGIAPAALAASPAIHVTRVAGQDSTLRVEFEAPVGAGSVEVWRSGTLEAPHWIRLEGAPVRNAATGQLELRLPIDPGQPQQFYRLEVPSDPETSGKPR